MANAFDPQVVDKLAGFGLDRLLKAKSVVDPADPDVGSLNEAIRRLQNPPLSPERQAKVQRNYEATKLPDGPAAQRDLGAEFKEDVGNLGRQANATAAAAVEGVGVGPWLEAGSDLAGRAAGAIIAPFARPPLPKGPEYEQAQRDVEAQAKRQLRADLPFAQGSLNRIIEEAPLPTVAKVTGAAAPPLAAAHGAGAVAQGTRALLKPAEALFKGAAGKAPGLIRTAGATGLVGAAYGTSGAIARRAPDVLTGQPVEPIGYMSEIAAPAAVGFGMGIIPGVMNWSTNPRTPTGVVANEYARNVKSGAYRTGELAEVPSGQMGIKEIADRNRARIASAREEAAQDFDTRLPERLAPIKTAKMRGEEDIAAARRETDDYATMERGQAAADVAPTVLRTLSDQVASARKELGVVMTSKAKQYVPAEQTRAAVRDVVSDLARSDTRGQSHVTKAGTTVSDEVFTPEGEAIRRVEDQLGGFLRNGGTVEDWVNAIRWLESQERGSPATARIYREVANVVRHGREVGTGQDGTPIRSGGLANEDPEIGAAWAKYREATTKAERASAMLLGEEDLSKVASKSAHGKLDVPLPGDPFTQNAQTIAEEEALRRNLMRVGQSTEAAAAKLPQLAELEQLGFSEPLRTMEGRAAEIENRRRAGNSALSDRAAALERETSAQEVGARRGLRTEANERVRDAVTESRRLDFAKRAQEASRWPRVSKLTTPAMLLGLGISGRPGIHSAFSLGHATGGLGTTLTQPFASAIAAHIPTPTGSTMAALPSMVGPGLLGMTLSLSERRDALDQADALVAGAKSHASR